MLTSPQIWAAYWRWKGGKCHFVQILKMQGKLNEKGNQSPLGPFTNENLGTSQWEGPPSALWATRSCSCLIQRLIRPDSFSCWILVLNLDQVNHLIERHVIWTSLYRASPFEEHKPHQRGKGNPGKEIRVSWYMCICAILAIFLSNRCSDRLTFMMCMLDSPNSLVNFFLMKKSSSCLASAITTLLLVTLSRALNF